MTGELDPACLQTDNPRVKTQNRSKYGELPMGESIHHTIRKTFRLGEIAQGHLDRIAAHYGFTETDAIRFALAEVASRLPPAPAPQLSPKKNPKKS